MVLNLLIFVGMSIVNFLSPCYACCSFISVDQSGFCAACKEKLFTQFAANKHKINGFNLIYLFNWKPDENRPLSMLLEDMKKGGNPTRSKYYGLKLLSQFLCIHPNVTSATIVPAPARIPGENDHAYLLAESIHQATGWKINTSLRRLDLHSQKHKNRQERRQTELSSESFSIDRDDSKPIVFVDDIVTTGSTAEAAYKALQRPTQFFILSIAHRRLALPVLEGFGIPIR
jgi:predicted amidophosphoribosyltransferase